MCNASECAQEWHGMLVQVQILFREFSCIEPITARRVQVADLLTDFLPQQLIQLIHCSINNFQKIKISVFNQRPFRRRLASRGHIHV